MQNKDIAEDVEKKLENSNLELDRTLPEGKNLKKYWINERWIRWTNHKRISWIKSKNKLIKRQQQWSSKSKRQKKVSCKKKN